jgi:hypothetical protein
MRTGAGRRQFAVMQFALAAPGGTMMAQTSLDPPSAPEAAPSGPAPAAASAAAGSASISDVPAKVPVAIRAATTKAALDILKRVMLLVCCDGSEHLVLPMGRRGPGFGVKAALCSCAADLPPCIRQQGLA